MLSSEDVLLYHLMQRTAKEVGATILVAGEETSLATPNAADFPQWWAVLVPAMTGFEAPQASCSYSGNFCDP